MSYPKPAIIFLSLLSFLGCTEQPKKPVEQGGYCLDESFKKDIEFVNAARQQIAEGVHLTGTIEVNPDKVVVFTSLFSGVVSNTFFSLGEKVKKGQVLAEISSVEYSSLNAELQSVESQIKVAETKLKSVGAMFNDGIASQKELNEAQSELDILNTQKEKVSSTRSLYSASNTRGVFQIKAPSSGIITAKSIAAGTQISAEGESLFTISDLSEVWVMLNIYTTNIRNIHEGMPVEIKTISYPDETFKGKIAAISQVYDNEARVLKARVVLPNSGLELKPGMLVDVVAMKQHHIEAISIPTGAIVFDGNQNFVIAYKSDCELEIRKVEILSKSNGITFLSEGLKENETIVSKNQLLIYEQLKNFQN